MTMFYRVGFTEGELMNIKEKIKIRLVELESELSSGTYLKSAEGTIAVLDLIASIAKFTSILSDEERDFINAAKVAVADKV
jgi:hypothetical protein